MPAAAEKPRAVNEAADALRDRLLIEGARLSYRQNRESMQRIHSAPVHTQRFMAAHAHATTTEVEASHVLMISRPTATTRLIVKAAHDAR